MPDRLFSALEEGATIVTASRRLSRALAREHARRMQSTGMTAWPTPAVRTYSSWLRELLEQFSGGRQPYCASALQCRVLWEQCIAAALGDARANLGAVVREAMDAWSLLSAYEVPVDEISREIDSRDQRVFARAAASYRDRLAALGWLDEALLQAQVLKLAEGAEGGEGIHAVLAGFDRLSPAQASLQKRLREGGARVEVVAPGDSRPVRLRALADNEAELRTAGRWARERLLENPDDRVAIIVSGLERDPVGIGRLVREGFIPGWQTAAPEHAAAVNVSLGSPLDDYPMVAVALLVVRWLHDPLTSRQLGVLLRCPFLGRDTSGARSRLETELRNLAARDWTPARTQRVFHREDPEPDVADFLKRVGDLQRRLEAQPALAPPRHWARLFEEALDLLGWPGEGSLDSLEHQLLNRWRELLGDFANLERVSGTLSLDAAGNRLRQLAREAVFQPEDTGATVSVLGPLEAAGLSFDALWVTGLTAEAWPGPGGASPLIARRVQRRYRLPDATPDDTRAFAAAVLERIGASANIVIGSFPLVDGDSEKGPSLLGNVQLDAADETADPGWHAAQYRGTRGLLRIVPEQVPPVAAGEKIRGGSRTINDQISEPFAAFAGGRLGIKTLDPFAEGLTPLLRGNLVHDALRRLYRECPTQQTIRAWSDDELHRRCRNAAHEAIRRHRFAAGSMLERLLDFEERRLGELLAEVVAVDRTRPPFRILSVEEKSSGTVGGVELSLRHDRLDLRDDGSLIILDYKTGAAKKFLEKGEPRDYQLVVYAATASAPVSDVGLYNVDRRAVEIAGAGITFSNDENFGETLAGWIRVVQQAGNALAKGDVRVNRVQAAADARWHGLLSRFQELVRDV